MKKLLIIFLLLFATTAHAVTVIPMPEQNDWLSRTLTKIYFCRYDLKCYFASPKLGVSITQIYSTTTIASFPTIHNANINALNDGKIENATTSLQSLTTAPNLATVGILTAGAWQANTLQSLYGGTGTTSLSKYRIVLGNGTASTTVATSTGSAGQYLISNGEGAFPSWQSKSADESANYNWTGTHTFSATTSVNARLAISTSTPSLTANLL